MDGVPKPHVVDRDATDLAPALTVAPGSGPFHIKGLVLHGLLEYVTQNVPGGPARVIDGIADPLIREYMKRSFLAASRYDIIPFLHTLAAAANVLCMPTSRFVAEHGAWQAERDVSGVYRLLLKVASPETVAKRLGLAWARYFDFAHLDVLSVTPGCVVLGVRQMPAVLVPWYKIAARAAGDTIIRLAGATDIKVGFTHLEPDGESAGFPLRRFELRRTWAHTKELAR